MLAWTSDQSKVHRVYHFLKIACFRIRSSKIGRVARDVYMDFFQNALI